MNPLTALSVDDIDSIHQASLTILRDVGVHVPHLGVLQALAESGAQGDALEHIDVVGGMAIPLDVPVAVRDVYMAAQLIS